MCYLHQKTKNDGVNPELLVTTNKLLNHPFNFRNNGYQQTPLFHLYLLEGMFLAEDVESMSPIFKDIEKKNLVFIKGDKFHHSFTLFKIIEAWYLFHMGKKNKAKTIINSISEFEILYNLHKSYYLRVKSMVL